MLSKVARRSPALARQLGTTPRLGTKLHGFTLVQSKEIPELQLTALILDHDKTGAQHLHIAREDSNNVFSIGFKTNPPDDTGVPHILEHTTLCGSQKYPIRDPFFKMMPRTLSNFMNAFTASDHTFYPFATTNAQDFKNLMSVYLDATLHPLLKETDFTQEGWRIGPENPQAIASGQDASPADKKLVFKGVVYNEMKGQMSDAGYLYYIRFQDHMFPSINNSGGDPQKMTELTYAQLKGFHAEHYHPSNAKTYTYGNLPLEDHLKELDAQFSAFEKLSHLPQSLRPIDLSSGPQEVTLTGPMDPLVDESRQFKTSVTWTMGDTKDVVESFSLALISALLMDGYGSPLYRGLIESGLGMDWSPNTGYDSSGVLGLYSIGLTGVQEADVPQVKTALFSIMQEARKKGFEQSKIQGYLHQIELGLKHKTANFGMSLMHRVKPKWFSDVHPFGQLDWQSTLKAFEERMAKGGYLEGLMDKYLLNDNTLTFTMAPSATFTQDLVREESDRLATKIADAEAKLGGSEGAEKALQERELLLLEEQGKTLTEDLSCLPTVHVKDIPRQKAAVVSRDEVNRGVTTQWHEAPTNDLTYFRAINTFKNLPDELRSLIPLFTDSIMRLGTKDKTMEELEDSIKLKTGGISVGYYNSSNPSDYTKATEGLMFTGMAFDKNVPEMFSLLHQLVAETNFDSPEAAQQIRQLVQTAADGVVNDIASTGHAYARRAAEAGLSTNGYLKEQVSGLGQIKLITSLASRPESDKFEDIIAKLKAIQQLAMTSGSLRTAVTCGHEAVAENTSSLAKFVSGFTNQQSAPSPPSTPKPLPRNLKTFYPLPYQVYYGALVLPTTSYTSPDTAPLQILSQLLTHKHLHHEIREKGGAYGGGAYSRSLDGVFGLYSYRDPNPQNTLNIMRGAGRWAVDKLWSDRDLEDAKISVFQGVDAPKSVNEEGMGRFLYGVTEEMKQVQRERLLDVDKEQVRDVAQRYLVDQLVKEEERTVFLGQKKQWVDDGSWTIRGMDVKKAGVGDEEAAA